MSNVIYASMIDIETLSTKSDAVVLQIGEVVFKYGPHQTLEVTHSRLLNLDIVSQIKEGRHVDAETVKWWLGSEEKQHILQSMLNPTWRSNVDDVRLFDEALTSDEDGPRKIQEYWFQGPQFDAEILENLFSEVPWKFDQVRDLRTLEGVFKTEESKKYKKEFVTHDALDDARAQVHLLDLYLKNANYYEV